MTSTIIHIDVDALDKRLDGGRLWTTGWGNWASRDGKTCLHGAIRFCQPIPGDARIIEQVGTRYRFGTSDNDLQADWEHAKALIVPDITDEMLADTFGPQWAEIVALVRRSAILTADESSKLVAASRAISFDARCDARNVASDAAWFADRTARWGAAEEAAGDAAGALVLRDVIGHHRHHGFTQATYDVLTGAWAQVIGPAHPDDDAEVAS